MAAITMTAEATRAVRGIALSCKARRICRNAENLLAAGKITPAFYRRACAFAAQLAFDGENYTMARVISASAGIKEPKPLPGPDRRLDLPHRNVKRWLQAKRTSTTAEKNASKLDNRKGTE